MNESTERQYEGLAASQKLVMVLYLAAAVWYLSWRPYTFNPDATTFSLLLYLAELYGFITAGLHIFMVSRLRTRDTLTPLPSASVDVFIPTVNESVETVHRTLLAAIEMEYPHNTWLLDDGDRAEMRHLAEELGCGYVARKERLNAKAGNLNNALTYSGAEFIAIFDADHAPCKDFLVKTLGYFRDPRVAFVQTPQDFYNLDSYQHRVKWSTRGMFTEQSLFFRVIQRGKDYWNAAFFCGSCAVLRRKALDDIGGFADETVTEDLHTSIRLHKRGYKSVYHAESLAFGIAPVSMQAFLTQRLRWGTGALQVWRKEGVLFAKGLTMAQKANYLASMLTYFDGWQKLVFYLTPAIVLYTQILPIASFGWEFMLHLIPYYLLTYWVFEEVGRGYGHSIYIEQYNMARFATFIHSTLAGWRNRTKFAITPKAHMGSQGAVKYIWPQYLVLVINLTAIAIAVSRMNYDSQLSWSAVSFNVFWAGINFWLALALMVFTVRLPVRRHDYRFPLLMPAKIKVHASVPHAIYAMAKDITQEGLRLRVEHAVENMSIGSVVSGELILPDGPAEFSGKVMSVCAGKDDTVDIGCLVDWRGANDDQRIERLLYGTDLQLRLNGLHEEAITPLQWVGRLLMPMRAPHPSLIHEWRTRLIRMIAGGAARQVLVVSGPSDKYGRQHMISSELIDIEQTIVMHEPSAQEQRWQRKMAVHRESIQTPLATLYLYELTPAREATHDADETSLAGHAGVLAYHARSHG